MFQVLAQCSAAAASCAFAAATDASLVESRFGHMLHGHARDNFLDAVYLEQSSIGPATILLMPCLSTSLPLVPVWPAGRVQNCLSSASPADCAPIICHCAIGESVILISGNRNSVDQSDVNHWSRQGMPMLHRDLTKRLRRQRAGLPTFSDCFWGSQLRARWYLQPYETLVRELTKF